jgi:REP element-mobilizing transposase RayT
VLFVMDMRYYFCFVGYSREKVFRKKKSGQLQRKVEKFGQTAKIIIFVCILDRN